jgi:GT2 family glycosyltransferase
VTAVISAIIVNYNAGDLIRECINSLLNCLLEIEIIVVDNDSSDGSVDFLRDFPQVKVIRNSINAGFAAGCNQGLKCASAESLLFLNPDCSFAPETLKHLLHCLQSQKQVGMVGGLLTNLDGSEQAGGRRAVPTPWRSFVRAFGLSRFANRWPRLFYDFHLHRQPLPMRPIEVEAISGACMLIKREALEDVGPWDEGYFLHCEDLDWCMRFRQRDWKVMFVPAARVTHALGGCSRNRRIFVEWHKHKSMIRFYRKFFRHQYPGLLMGLVVVGVWLRFGVVAGYHLTRRLGHKLRLVRG